MAGRFWNVLKYMSNRETVFGNGIYGIHSSKFVKDQARRTKNTDEKNIHHNLCVGYSPHPGGQ